MPTIASQKLEIRRHIHRILMKRYRSQTESQRKEMFLATIILFSATKTLKQLQAQKDYLEEG